MTDADKQFWVLAALDKDLNNQVRQAPKGAPLKVVEYLRGYNDAVLDLKNAIKRQIVELSVNPNPPT